MRLVMCLVFVFFAQSLGSTFLVAADEPEPLNVLLLSGQNNHDWKRTTPVLKNLLEITGRFKVKVNERPDQLTATVLRRYDVIVSNWNAYGKGKGAIISWPATTQKAYLEFIRSGGGHVVVHAGSSSFVDWPEYRQLTLAAWQPGQTGHGSQHQFPVQMTPAKHPITSGLSSFTTRDELWHRSGIPKGSTVLATAFSSKENQGSGDDEPIALVRKFGKGRSFTLLLGHGPEHMKNSGFELLLCRGTEWAASGQVTIKSVPHSSNIKATAK